MVRFRRAKARLKGGRWGSRFMSGLGAPEGGGGRAELAVGVGEMHGCPFSVAGGSGVL